MLVSLITSLAGLAATEFPDDPEQFSAWMQQSCQVQQMRRSGGEASDHDAFCSCLDGALSAGLSPAAYRVIALGSQGAIQDEAMVDDWEAARDAAASEVATLDPEEQSAIQPALQSGLGTCLPLSYQGE
ncbi:hypothetical protein [Maricaulis sp.]|uniref:hypothetical protein n=1 Tax=Maricaulis sp. TaxID=1486257 RepID=UPI0025C1023D|nr:hypothetical protein [Maricaulis sp.]